MKEPWSGSVREPGTARGEPRGFLRRDGGLQLLEWSIVALGIAIGALALFQALASFGEPLKP